MKNIRCIRRFAALLLVFTVAAGTMAGCGKDKNNTDNPQQGTSGNPQQTQPGEETTSQAVSHDNEERSLITGKWVPKDTVNNVPVAVMYSNIKDAMPQSSISYADIVMESLVEGGITRLCAIFENKPDLVKIGPVRSCRLYYLTFAKEFEAAYVHFGYSDIAEKYLKMPKMHAIDGMTSSGFYRSTDRVAPHNAYTSWSAIMENVASKGYPETYPDGYKPPLKFNTDDDNEIDFSTSPIALPANKVVPGYPYNKPWFEYNENEKLYYRYQFGGAQVDKETGEQLAFKNILIKFVEGEYIDGTPAYLESDAGMGYYITNGYAVPITWWKLDETGQGHYYDAAGEELTINQGKTFICYVEEQFVGNISIAP